MGALQFILLLILSLAHTSFAQHNLYFKYLTTEQGLPSNTTSAIAQDHQSFMWIGSWGEGISRYDGYNFKVYESLPDDTTTLSHNSINAVYEDSNHNLWVGTWNGLNLYNRKLDNFTRFLTSANDTEKKFNSILEDSNNRLWAGGRGLYQFQKKDSTFRSYVHSINDFSSLSDGQVNAIVEDLQQSLWVATRGGLNQYNELTDDFTRYPIPAEITSGISSFCIDHLGRFWVGTWRNGLWLFNPADAVYINYYKQVAINGDYNEFITSIKKVFQDAKNNIWITTDGSGLCYLNPESRQMYVHMYDPFLNGAISDNNLISIYQDRQENLWIGSYNSGISVFDSNHSNFKRYFHNPSDPKSLSSNLVNGVYEDDQGDLWISTDGGGINQLRLDENSIATSNTILRYDKNDPNSLLPSDKTYALMQDSDGWMWVKTWGGPAKFNPKSGDFVHPEKGLVHEDRDGNYWLVGDGGLFFYNTNTNESVHYPNHDVWDILEDQNGNIWIADLSEGLKFVEQKDQIVITVIPGMVKSVVEDEKGILWLATLKDGLVKYEPESKQITKLNRENGFLTDDCRGGLLIDNIGFIWIGSNEGIIRFDPRTETMINFGLLEENLKHYIKPLAQTSDGLIYLGGSKGIIAFDPENIKDPPAPPAAIFTNFQLFNKEVPIGEKSVLKSNISETQEIVLDYKQDVFTIEYTSLSFKPTQTLYAYKMEGYDDEWREVSTLRTATYTNLDAGTYDFKVRAGNQNGVWNEQESTLSITILPPPWKTWWAYTMYSLLVIGLLFIWRNNLVRRERLKNKMQLEHLELEKVKEMDQMKTQFFANISHEFRTPLTLILGPLKQMYEGTFKGDAHAIIAVMIRNSKRLMNLINQLLDFSKLEAGAVTLQACEDDIVKFTRTLFSAFESTAQIRNINYVFQSNLSSILTYYDHDKLEKVIINLLSNAFKFTKDEGSIYLKMNSKVINPSVDKGEGVLEIRFEDSGSGIPADKLPHIFDRFYQADPSSTRQQEGTGIGLALAKELVELHYGSLTAQSKVGEGTTFTVHLPLGKSHLNDQETVVRKGYESIDTTALEALPESLSIPTNEKYTNGGLPLLLVIDDNEDMRMYLREVMSGIYQLAEATNGLKGWEYAIEHIPELIISDVMMPEMDGHELCQKLKTDVRTSHIPVVLLTARAGEEAKVEGLETGADDYITKPFSPVELKARVQNLIELRRKLREQFGRDLSIFPKGTTITSMDERFMERALKILEIHRSDADYSVEEYAKEIGMSRSQLHRKFKALTSQTASEFIRCYRIKYARQLIQKEFGNMAQIAYECGFNNPSYFAECFRKQFGVVPSEFAKLSEDLKD